MDRRNFVKTTGVLGAMSVLPRYSMAQVKGSDRIKIGLIGCGHRGTGALRDLFTADSNTQLFAMADIFEDRIPESLKKTNDFLDKTYPEKKSEMLNIPQERIFMGFDGYKKVLECGVDIVILATPAIFRYEHIKAAIEAKVHVFAEKPFATDIITLRKMYELIDLANKAKISVVAGTQRRYHEGYIESIKRVQDGQIGEILSAEAVWLSNGYAGYAYHKDEGDPNDLRYQLRNFFCFIWSSGDCIVDQVIHNVDVCRWAIGDDKNPIEVWGYGGRNIDLPSPKYGDRYSNFTVHYTYANGVTLTAMSRQEPKSASVIMEKIVGTKGILEMGTYPDYNRIIGQNAWEFKSEKPVNYLSAEHAFLLSAVREGRHVNKIKALLDTNLMMIVGRQAAYSGQRFKYDWTMQKSQEKLVPDVIDLNAKLPVGNIPNATNYKLV